jgi:hypothetical protein
MHQGDYAGEVIMYIEEVANMLLNAAQDVSTNVVTIKIVSNDKVIAAVNYDMRTSKYHAVSTSQITHWVGMPSTFKIKGDPQ